MIVTFLNQETLAAKQATNSIPIVMVLGVFPEHAGLVAGLARPGDNVTGTTVAPIVGKYLELVKLAVPKLGAGRDRLGPLPFLVSTRRNWRLPLGSSA